ncbi:MAG: type II toxin-antitoxin system ParD family antitoxin [Pseudomonadota bacterium]
MMKNVSISLTDQHASEIDAHISSGDYASVSEVVRAALREFLAKTPGPTLDQIDQDIARYRMSLEKDEALISPSDALERLRTAIKK